MRITVDDSGTSAAAREGGTRGTAQDVELPEGSRLGDLRAALGAVTGAEGVADPAAALAIGDLLLDDEQVVGQSPLEAGCVLRVGRGHADAASLALRADWHLAVVSGPDCGALIAVDPHVTVGRAAATAVVAPTDVLELDDPLVSRRHLDVRRRGVRLVVQDLGSANGTVRQRAGRAGRARSRRVRRTAGLAWRRLRHGDRLVVGATVLEVRGRCTSGDARPPGRPGPSQDSSATRSSVMLTTWLTPAITSGALALSTGNRALLLLALTGPAVGAAHLLTRRRGRRRSRDDPRTAPPAGDPRSPDGASRGGVLTDDPPCPADVVTSAIRRLEGHPGATEPARVRLEDLVPGACLAVVGPLPLARATVRGLLLALAVDGSAGSAGRLRVSHPCASADQWSWVRWLTDHPDAGVSGPEAVPAAIGPYGSAPRAVTTVVEPHDGTWPSWLATSSFTAPVGSEILLVAGEDARVPAWCRTVLEVREGRGSASLRLPDGQVRPVPLPAVSVAFAERQARRAAALSARPAAGRRSTEPPTAVTFDELPGLPPTSADAVAARWARASTDGLVVTLGLGAGGRPVSVDLTADGPHALIAGTTGAGKSALLQTLLLGAALAYSPADLAIALVDFKGGAGFGECARLPHVVGQVTDLDPSMATRALAGLRAELRRRERVLAAAEVAGLAELRALRRGYGRRGTTPRPSAEEPSIEARPDDLAPPPRLLVVVDEFRALADDLPEFLPDLLRIAAQGRSLGMHLVLATQRPGGAVSADMRANIALRIALRVTDPADSHDIVGAADAATIPASLPGRAVLRRAGGDLETVQVAHLGPSCAAADPRAVRLAAPWRPWRPEVPSVPDAVTALPERVAPTGPAPAVQTPLDRYVASVRGAAVLVRSPRPHSPWLPDLPVSLAAAGLEVRHDTDHPGLPLALADAPETQSRSVVTVEASEHLLVIGGPGSGRSTALHTLAAAALRRGWHVHAVGLPDAFLTDLAHRRGLGTVVGHEDPRRLARLLTALGRTSPESSSGPTTLLVVDGLEQSLDALSAYARGAGDATLIDLLRGPSDRPLLVVASAGPAAPASLRSSFPARLVLAVPDPTFLGMLGVPRELAAPHRVPGRGVHLGGGASRRRDLAPRVCQVAVDVLEPPSRPGGRTTDGDGPAAPLRIRPLPLLAERPPVPTAAVGVGGDDARDVVLDLSLGALVVGPPGSGRSTALAALATGLPPTVETLRVTRDGRGLLGAAPVPPGAVTRPAVEGRGAARDATTFSFGSDDLRRLAARVATADDDAVVVIDDLDDLESVRPAETALVLSALERASGARLRLLASGRTARVATSYREPWAGLRAARRGIVLSPAAPGSSDVFGVPLGWHADVARPHHPGRGVVQAGAVVTPVQVYREGPCTPDP